MVSLFSRGVAAPGLVVSPRVVVSSPVPTLPPSVCAGVTERVSVESGLIAKLTADTQAPEKDAHSPDGTNSMQSIWHDYRHNYLEDVEAFGWWLITGRLA